MASLEGNRSVPPSPDVQAVNPQQPTSTDSENDERNRLKRRTILKRSACIAGGVVITPVAIRAGQIADFVGYGRTELDTHLHHATSEHSQRSMQRTHIVVLGDSIARGYDTSAVEPRSSGEYIRDALNHPHRLGASWESTVLAQNGAVINDLTAQIEQVPEIVQGEKDVDLIVSIGGNDFRRAVSGLREQALEVYKNPLSLVINPLDLELAEEISTVAGRFQTTVIPHLRELSETLAAQGTSVNRIAFINLPNMAKTDYELHTEDPGIPVIRYSRATRRTDRNGNFLESLGRELTRKANSTIGNVIWDARDELGADVLSLDAYSLEGEELNGYHPTLQGQQMLAVHYLQKTFTPLDYSRKPHATLLDALR